MTDNKSDIKQKKQYGHIFRIVSTLLGACVLLGAIVTAILSIIYGGLKYWYVWIPVLVSIFIGSAMFQAGLKGHDPFWLFDTDDDLGDKSKKGNIETH